MKSERHDAGHAVWNQIQTLRIEVIVRIEEYRKDKSIWRTVGFGYREFIDSKSLETQLAVTEF